MLAVSSLTIYKFVVSSNWRADYEYLVFESSFRGPIELFYVACEIDGSVESVEIARGSSSFFPEIDGYRLNGFGWATLL